MRDFWAVLKWETKGRPVPSRIGKAGLALQRISFNKCIPYYLYQLSMKYCKKDGIET